MTTARLPSAASYWRLVQDCLVEFYGFQESQATSSVASTRKRLRQLGVKSGRMNMLFHSEPIDVASDIAKEPFPSSSDFVQVYEKLKLRRLRSSKAEKAAVGKRAEPKRVLLGSPSEPIPEYVAYTKAAASGKR